MFKIVNSIFLLGCLLAYAPAMEALEKVFPGITIHHNIPSDHQGPRIALITFISDAKSSHQCESYHPYPETVKFGTRSKELYCQKHGYDFIIGSEKLYECDGHPAPNKEKLSIHWMKVPMLARFLSDYDWVIWTDADSIFLNPDITLESYLDDSYDILFGTHHLTCQSLNTGHIFVKCNQWSRDFLNEWWTYSEEYQEGTWDLENLTMMLQTKSRDYLNHIKRLPTKVTDLSADEYEPGDFIVHFYAYHGKELYEIFQIFEEKYGHVIDKLENELLEERLSQDRYTDHIKVFKKIFDTKPIRGLLEFGLGNSTRYFLKNLAEVVSVEFITNALSPEWLNLCLDRYQADSNWHPFAFLSGCTKKTYSLANHANLKLFQASPKLYDANSLASHHCNRSKYPLDPGFADDLNRCLKKILKQHAIDVAFVDSGLILRGELVQSLFNKVPIIAAHDFPENIAEVDPDTDIYGYSFIPSHPKYQEFFIGPPFCQQGLKIWVKNTTEFFDLLQTLTDLSSSNQ
ncbi:DUF273 domain-containing protein [Estrella lausannensis]|uniref:Putative secreted protein n=1 Tax=Estrella lausannensis TaxID=483423 RepID=A0A0H5DT72_9BACT|nr:DUF273 domain-containing protein [Estrella lausannensis]CRX39019.1 putative secreted protein [Estrella lausannensis]